MNCLFILVLLGCCGHRSNWGWNRERNDSCGCGCSERRERSDSCERRERNDCRGCSERNERNDGCGERRERDDSCGCERRERNDGCDRADSRMMRYDEGMRSYGRMDTVPEMRDSRESMSRSFPMYPESCGCNDRS